MEDEQYEIVDYTTASSWESFISIIENTLLNWNLENGSDPIFHSTYDLATLQSIVGSDSVSLTEKIEATLNWSIMLQEIEYLHKNFVLMLHRHPSFHQTLPNNALESNSDGSTQHHPASTKEKANAESSIISAPNFDQLFPQVYISDKHSQNSCLNEIDGVIDTDLMCFHPLHRWTGLNTFLSIWCYGNSSSKNSDSRSKTGSGSGASKINSHNKIAQVLSLDNSDISPDTAKLLQSALNVASTNTGCTVPSFVPLGVGWNYLYGGKQNQSVSLISKSKLNLNLDPKPDPANYVNNNQNHDSLSSAHITGLRIDTQNTEAFSSHNFTHLFQSTKGVVSIDRVYESIKSLQITPDLHNIYGLYNAFITRFKIPNLLNDLDANGFTNSLSYKLRKTNIAASYSYKIHNKYDKLWNKNVDGFFDQLSNLKIGPVNDPLRQLGLIAYFAPTDISQYIDGGSNSSNQLYLKNANEYKLACKFLDYPKDRTMLSEALNSIIEAYFKTGDELTSILTDPDTPNKISLYNESFTSSLYSILSYSTNNCRFLNNELDNSKLMPMLKLTSASMLHLEPELEPKSDSLDSQASQSIRLLINRTRHGTCVRYESVLWKFCKHVLSSFTLYTADYWRSPNWTLFFSLIWALMLKDFKFRWENELLIPDVDLLESSDLINAVSCIDLRYNIIQQKIDMINSCIIRKKLHNSLVSQDNFVPTSFLQQNIDHGFEHLSSRIYELLNSETERLKQQQERLQDREQEKLYRGKFGQKLTDELHIFSPILSGHNHLKSDCLGKDVHSSKTHRHNASPASDFSISHHVSSIISQNLERVSTPSAAPKNIDINFNNDYRRAKKTPLNHHNMPSNDNTYFSISNQQKNMEQPQSNHSAHSNILTGSSYEFYNSAESPSNMLINGKNTKLNETPSSCISNVAVNVANTIDVGIDDDNDSFIDANTSLEVNQDHVQYEDIGIEVDVGMDEDEDTGVKILAKRKTGLAIKSIDGSLGRKSTAFRRSRSKSPGTSLNNCDERAANYVDVGFPSSFNSVSSDYFIIAGESPIPSLENDFQASSYTDLQRNSLDSYDSFIGDIKTTKGQASTKSIINSKIDTAGKAIKDSAKALNGKKPILNSSGLLSHEYRGRLAILPNTYILGSNPPEPVWVPITQQPPLFTEDMLLENEAKLVNMGDGVDSSILRSEHFSQELLSDMEAFKAANPHAQLVDFIRWHSPKDWISTGHKTAKSKTEAPTCSELVVDIQTTKNKSADLSRNSMAVLPLEPSKEVNATNPRFIPETSTKLGLPTQDAVASDSNFKTEGIALPQTLNTVKADDLEDDDVHKIGYLSARMSEKGNAWEKLWDKAKRVPVCSQVSRCDYDIEGAKALAYLESIDLNDLFLMLFPTIVAVALDCITKEPIVHKLKLIQSSIESLGNTIVSCSNAGGEISHLLPKLNSKFSSSCYAADNTIIIDSDSGADSNVDSACGYASNYNSKSNSGTETHADANADANIDSNSGITYATSAIAKKFYGKSSANSDINSQKSSSANLDSTVCDRTFIEFPKIHPGSKGMSTIIESLKATEVNLGRAVSLLNLMPNQHSIVDRLISEFEVKIASLQEKKSVLKALSKFGIGTSRQPVRKEYVLTSNFLQLNLPLDADEISFLSLNDYVIYNSIEGNATNVDFNNGNLELDPGICNGVSSSEKNQPNAPERIDGSGRKYNGPLHRMYASVEDDGRARFMFTSSTVKNMVLF